MTTDYCKVFETSGFQKCIILNICDFPGKIVSFKIIGFDDATIKINKLKFARIYTYFVGNDWFFVYLAIYTNKKIN